VLNGVALACSAMSDASQTLSENYKELREVERLMGAFSGELTKLDEILEVLSAYARRMRSSSSAPIPRVLH
jgi:hypothetical protein